MSLSHKECTQGLMYSRINKKHEKSYLPLICKHYQPRCVHCLGVLFFSPHPSIGYGPTTLVAKEGGSDVIGAPLDQRWSVGVLHTVVWREDPIGASLDQPWSIGVLLLVVWREDLIGCAWSFIGPAKVYGSATL